MLIISWKLSDSEKAPYQEEEKKLRAQYHIEAENWKKRMQEEQEAEKAEKKARKKVDAEKKEARHPQQEPAPPRFTGPSAFTSSPYFASRSGQ